MAVRATWAALVARRCDHWHCPPKRGTATGSVGGLILHRNEPDCSIMGINENERERDTMAGNSSLGAAKAAKNDEFYTQYSDIEAEMNAYVEYNPDVFRGKTILLPCDDPEWSNFTKYSAVYSF